eukprot:m.56302 g.56302  ORF g.56302 m.56302 type:complete len:333 (-) comp13009_c0_seq1:804-1802(-)
MKRTQKKATCRTGPKGKKKGSQKTKEKLKIQLNSKVHLELIMRAIALESSGVLLKVLDKVIKFTTTGVFLTSSRSLLASRVELESREATDGETINFVGSTIHLCNNKVLVISILLTQLVVNGLKLLAVSAPWSVDLKEHILGLVKNNIVEVLSNDNGDWTIVILGNILRLEGRLQVTGKEGIKMGLDGAGIGCAALQRIFLHLSTSLEDVESWEVALLDTNVVGQASLGRVRGSKDKLALVLLGNIRISLVLRVGEEEGNFANLGLEDFPGNLHGERNDEGKLMSSNKLGNLALGEVTIEDVLAFVKLLEEDNGRSRNSGVGGSSAVCCHTI